MIDTASVPCNDHVMILYFAADLLWATRIKSSASALGLQARPVRTLEMLDARLDEGAPSALIVDLDNQDVAVALIRRLRERSEHHNDESACPVVLAFGPHVAVEAFEAAREAGADAAIPRGGFANSMDRVLGALGRGELPGSGRHGA